MASAKKYTVVGIGPQEKEEKNKRTTTETWEADSWAGCDYVGRS